MPINYLVRTKLRDIDFDELNWDVPINDNTAILNAVAPIWSLMVTTTEVPSGSLNISVAPGNYIKNDGSMGTYAGAASQAVAAASTRYVYLDSSGNLQVAASYPTTGSIIRLAKVITDGSTVTSITDDRVTMALPYMQRAGAAQAAVATTASTNTSPYGYSTQAQADAIVTLVNEIRQTLVSAGLMKGSA